MPGSIRSVARRVAAGLPQIAKSTPITEGEKSGGARRDYGVAGEERLRPFRPAQVSARRAEEMTTASANEVVRGHLDLSTRRKHCAVPVFKL
jgi:hypothetical protein